MKKTALTIALFIIVFTATYSQNTPVLEVNIIEKFDKPVEAFIALIAELDKKIASSPQNDALYAERGELYYLLERFEEALNDLNKAVALKPGNAEYYSFRASAYNALNRYYEALIAINLAMSYDPENNKYLLNRGIIYSNMGQFHEAEDDLTKAINRGNISRKVYATRSWVYSSLGKLDEAISDITKEIELYPGNFLDIHTRCELYIVQGKIDEALADVNGLWAITPPEMVFAIYTLRLWANSKKGKWQEALHDANRAVEANPEHPSMYINRARVYEKLAEITKKKKEKTEYQRRAREDQVTHDKVMAMWGEKLGQKGQ